MRQGLSLRARIVALAIVVVAIVLTAGGWLLVSALRQELVGDLADAARLRSQDLAALAVEGGLPDPIPIGDTDEALVQVVVGTRVVAASANVAGRPPLLADPPPAGSTSVTGVTSLPVADDDDPDGFVVAATSARVVDGTATVYVASSLEDVAETLAAATRLGLLALPALVAVLGGAIWVLVGRTLAPVDAIRAEAEAITGSDLHRRVPESSRGDEIGRLAQTLNRMLGRLEDGALRRRRFVADAAHELRTPVASIRTRVETARAADGRIDWDEVSEDVLTDAIRMQRLSEQLLLLARVDAGQLDGMRRVMDLDDAVSGAIDRHRAVEGVTVAAAAVRPVQVVGDPVLLEQLVLNLVDNAVAHARGRVEVALREEQGTAVLTVDDDGFGIPAEHRGTVFERFTRLDDARAREHDAGTGLGLAIVADIVDAHRGTVAIDDAALGGARVEVRLPCGD